MFNEMSWLWRIYQSGRSNRVTMPIQVYRPRGRGSFLDTAMRAAPLLRTMQRMRCTEYIQIGCQY
jgi:hypothetical protein